MSNTLNLLAKSGMLTRFFTCSVPFLLFPFLAYSPVEEDIDRTLTECPFYAIPDIPEVHYFYEVYHPWPYDKPNWGN